MASSESESDLLKRALTTQFKVFAEQAECLRELLASFNDQHLFDPTVSSGPETRMLPVNEPTPFEQGLLVHLNRHQGVKREAVAELVKILQSLPVRADLSSYQRECIALSVAVLRNTDNLQDLTQILSLGGVDVLSRWARVST